MNLNDNVSFAGHTWRIVVLHAHQPYDYTLSRMQGGDIIECRVLDTDVTALPPTLTFDATYDRYENATPAECTAMLADFLTIALHLAPHMVFTPAACDDIYFLLGFIQAEMSPLAD